MNNEVPVDRKGLMGEVAELILRSHVAISPSELSNLAFEDFGLGNPRIEGFGYVDILRTIALRITILALLPGQTLPEHFHPPYDGHIGKEETLRVVYGETRIYIPGEKNNETMIVPAGKEAYYKALHEIRLHRGE